MKRKTLEVDNLEIIIPAYNEEKRIGKTLEAYLEYCQTNKNTKIFVVINGTKDNTETVVAQYARAYPDILRYEVVTQKIGKGGAVVYGMSRSKADLIGFVDADNSITPQWFDTLVQTLVSNSLYEGAIASRALPASILENRNRRRIAISQGFNLGVNFLFHLNFKDTQCGGKLFRKEALGKILPGMKLANMAFDVDMLYNARKHDLNIAEVPIHWIDEDGLTTRNPTKLALIMGLSTLELRLIHSPFSFLRVVLSPFFALLLSPADRPLRFLQKELVFPHDEA